MNALNADPNATLVAAADVFPDKLAAGLRALETAAVGGRVRVAAEMRFAGFDGYLGVVRNADVVLLATPPHFRPLHLGAAVDAGRHVFCEAPAAVDVPGAKKVAEACRLARQKGLSVVSGLSHRHDEAVRETVARVRDGAVGRIVTLQGTYNTGGRWVNARGGHPEWTDMEWQLRNWRQFKWLGGDAAVEQHVHLLDIMLWLMRDVPPAACTASGGRTVLTAEEHGNVYDHFDMVFEWADGVRAFCQGRQWPGCEQDVSNWAFGTRGVADLTAHRITGENEWRGRPGPVNRYDAELVALLKSVRDGKPVTDGDRLVTATLMGIMGRTAAYTGTTVKWDQLLGSTLDLTPPKYELGPLPVPPPAVPGQTTFI